MLQVTIKVNERGQIVAIDGVEHRPMLTMRIIEAGLNFMKVMPDEIDRPQIELATKVPEGAGRIVAVGG